jgi:hypothetical protein
LAAVYSNAYIISFADKTSATAALQVVSIINDVPNKGKVVSSMQTSIYLYEIATLSDGLFIGICQDISSSLETAFVVAGTVDRNSYSITLGNVAQYTANYSVNPQITRLSDTEFAMTYYSFSPAMLVTRFGKIQYF